ncbi:unnamed protein product [Dicrocoelium dendriticum]|nr:unnamed protein product [Dicrocoelium dendriticum]
MVQNHMPIPVTSFIFLRFAFSKLRHSAANVLRETWMFYKHTRLVKRVNHSRVRRHQRKFLTAISRLRKAKDDQRKLKEDASSMVDIAKVNFIIRPFTMVCVCIVLT